MSYEVICHGCGNTGAVNRLTANLRCTCGSDDVGLFSAASMDFGTFMAAAHGPGTGWGADMPDPLKGSNLYAGPMPGPNPRKAPEGPAKCPNCKGTGWSAKEKCRACGGTGERTPTTANPRKPQVAKHPGQTSTPFMGRRRTPQKTATSRRLLMIQTVSAANPGLSKAEVQDIVTRTMRKYPE